MPTNDFPDTESASTFDSGFLGNIGYLRRAWQKVHTQTQVTIADDPVAQRLLSAICTVLLAVALLGVAIVAFGWQEARFAPLYALLAAMSGLSLFLVRQRHHVMAARVALWGLLALSTVNCAMFGGVYGAGLPPFVLLIALAAWLIGLRPAQQMALATGVIWLALYVAGQSGWLPQDQPGSGAGHALYLGMLLMGVTVLGVMTRRSYQVALAAEVSVRDAIAAREAQLRKLSLAIDQAPTAFMTIGAGPAIEYVNRALCEATGFRADELLGVDPRLLLRQTGLVDHYAEVEQAIRDGAPWRGERQFVRKDGTTLVENTVVVPVRDTADRVAAVLVMSQDITAERVNALRVQRLSNFDHLTELPNERLFRDKVQLAIAEARKSGKFSAIAVVNLRRFKTINSARGREYGDRVLKTAARLMRGIVRDSDWVSRQGTSEFAIYLHQVGKDAAEAGGNARIVAGKIHEALARAQLGSGQGGQASSDTAEIAAAIGISIVPMDDADTVTEGTRRATAALIRAEEDPRPSPTAVFEPGMGDRVEQRFSVERELRAAIELGELRLFLQSQVNAAGDVVGAEALVRWQHPVRGMVPPAGFIPIAEETGIVVQLDRWVLAQACRFAADAHRRGQRFRVSVNISPRQFTEDDFVQHVQQCLVDTGLTAAALTLEVTEGVLVHDIDAVAHTMRALTLIGVRFALDDFGTGYSSLSYLHRLPLAELKIDRSFVQGGPNEPGQAAVVDAMIAVAGGLKLEIVAEGVETAEQADFILRRAPHALLQGYRFSRPTEAAQWSPEPSPQKSEGAPSASA